MIPKETEGKQIEERLVDIEELRIYAKALDYLARSKSTDIFPNKNHNHAAIAISTILKYAKHDFILYDDDLQGDIVNNEEIVSFRSSLIEFISVGGKIKIIINDKNETDDLSLRKYLEILAEMYPNQVELRRASQEFKKSMWELYNEKINFAVGDGNKYRLELYGQGSTDEKTRRAAGSFNNQDVPAQLLSKFKESYKTCEKY